MINFKNKINGIKEIWHFDNRWQILFTRFFFSKEKINIYRFKDLEILIDHSAGDSNGAREVLTSDMYRKFLDRMDLSSKINVLDLGSNNGGFPLLLKSENIEINKLVCIEFNPKTFSRMRFNIERNFDCEFVPMDVAVCGENKTLNIAFGRNSTSDNIFQKANESNGKFQQIEGLTFDEIFQRCFKNEIVDICKIDIEGAEFEVFQNKEYELLVNCRYLLIEIHHEADRPREIVRKKIRESGFDEISEIVNTKKGHYVHFFENKKLRFKFVWKK